MAYHLPSFKVTKCSTLGDVVERNIPRGFSGELEKCLPEDLEWEMESLRMILITTRPYGLGKVACINVNKCFIFSVSVLKTFYLKLCNFVTWSWPFCSLCWIWYASSSKQITVHFLERLFLPEHRILTLDSLVSFDWKSLLTLCEPILACFTDPTIVDGGTDINIIKANAHNISPLMSSNSLDCSEDLTPSCFCQYTCTGFCMYSLPHATFLLVPPSLQPLSLQSQPGSGGWSIPPNTGRAEDFKRRGCRNSSNSSLN